MIKLRDLIIENRTIPVVIGIVTVDDEVLSTLIAGSHSQLGYHYGSRWRYNPETKIVYWACLNRSSQTHDDEVAVDNHLHKKYGYKVKEHIDMNCDGGHKYINVAHGMMHEELGDNRKFGLGAVDSQDAVIFKEYPIDTFGSQIHGKGGTPYGRYTFRYKDGIIDWSNGHPPQDVKDTIETYLRRRGYQIKTHTSYYDNFGPEDDFIDETYRKGWTEDDFSAENDEYFKVGQETPESTANSFCWIWSRADQGIRAKKGKTHGWNFGHEIAGNTFKGWYDPEKKAISFVFPENSLRKFGGRKPTVDDIPTTVYNKLVSQFGNDNKIIVFENKMNKNDLKKLIKEVAKQLFKETITGLFWWMGPDYQFYKVSFEEHRYWAEEYLKKKGFTIYDSTDVYGIMYGLGFVRVVKTTYGSGDTLSYTYSKKNPLNAKQIGKLRDWAIEQNCEYLQDDVTRKEEILQKNVSENLTYDQLLKLTDKTPQSPEDGTTRIDRAKNVRARSIPVTTEENMEQWNFRYKSNPSVTEKPFEGNITFLKGQVDSKDDAAQLECKVDCGCPDYRYKFAYNNFKQGAGEIGPDSLNKCINRAPQQAYDIGEGLCKHLTALRGYLQTKISSTRKSNLFEAVSDVAKQGPFNITYYD